MQFEEDPHSIHMPTDEKTRNIKVHLVHGTWANGLLRSRQAWFDQDSVIYNRLKNCLPSNSEIDAFTWSGKNTIQSRAAAAESFCRHLQESIHRHPYSDHIVVAHSHGGTVAAEALSQLSESSEQSSHIKGLICMATPFVKLVKPPPTKLETGFLSFGALVVAFFWSLAIAIFPSILNEISPTWLTLWIVAAGLILFIISMILAGYLYARTETSTSGKGKFDVPIFLLRRTRDEASLVLGLMQAFSWISAIFSRHIDIQLRPHSKLAAWLMQGLVFTVCLVCGTAIARFLRIQLGASWSGDIIFAIALLVYAPAVAGAIYFSGYALLAVAVGHTKISRWLTTAIDVDSAPPNMFCRLKIYADTDLSTNRLRHSLYEDEDVMEDLVDIVSRLASSKSRSEMA